MLQKLLVLYILFFLGNSSTSQTRVFKDGAFINPDSTTLNHIFAITEWINNTSIYLPTKYFEEEIDTFLNEKIYDDPILDTFNNQWKFLQLKDFLKPSMITLSDLSENFLFDFVFIGSNKSVIESIRLCKKYFAILNSRSVFLNDTTQQVNIISKLYSLISLCFDRNYKDIYLYAKGFNINYLCLWNKELVVSESIKKYSSLQSLEWSIYKPLECHSANFSIPTTTTISNIASKYYKLTYSNFNDTAVIFLKEFQKQLKLKSTLSSIIVLDDPPRMILFKAKGFITGENNFWEKVEIKIDKFFKTENNTIVLTCSSSGIYIPQNTERISDDVFKGRVLVLDDHFPTQLAKKNQELIDYFKSRLK